MNQDVVAYFITWTCYGTFLPGDERGWIKWHKGDQVPQPRLEDWCRDSLVETPVTLDRIQREIVNAVIQEHCEIRNWTLHAVNCRSNHCHVVVTAPSYDGQVVRDQFKSWAKRRLKAASLKEQASEPTVREHWWTKKGSVRKLFNLESVYAAIEYTMDAQDAGGSKANFR